MNAFLQGETCDSAWLPPCPACSWIAVWRRAALDVLEAPGFYLARHTTARENSNYYMLRGCSHATNVGLKLGVLRNRLKIAIAWRRRCAELAHDLFQVGYNDAQRAIIHERLGHPSMRSIEVAAPEPSYQSQASHVSRAIGSVPSRLPYTD